MLASFDRVVVTASNLAQSELFKHELERRKGRYFSETCIVQAIADPLGWRIGSGGATFQAIAEAYDGSNLLILHSGGDSRRNPLCTVSGKAFAEVNLDPAATAADTPLDRLLEQLSSLLPLHGVLIAATDTLMTHFEVEDRTQYQSGFSSTAVTGIGIYAPWEFGTRHGVFYKASYDANNKARFGILQKASEEELREMNAIDELDEVLLDSGIVFLGESVAKSIQELIKSPPFSGLSAKGLDSGLAKPIRFELYTDVMGSLKDVCSTEDFLNESSNAQEREIRSVLLEALGNFDLRVLNLAKKCRFIHVGTTREHRNLLVMKESYEGLTLTSRKKSFIGGLGNVAPSAILLNSHVSGGSELCQIQDFAVVEHSVLRGFFHIGHGAFVSNVEADGLHVPDNIVIQQLNIDSPKLKSRFKDQLQDSPALQKIVDSGMGKGDIYVLSIFGVNDAIKDIFPKSKFCNELWGELANLADEIWPNENIERSLWTARLFPILMRGEPQEHATWLMHRANGARDAVNLIRWRSAFRVSLSDLCWIADMDSLVQWKYEQLPGQILLDRLIQTICKRTTYPSDCYPISLPDSKNDHAAKRKTRLLKGLDAACGLFSDESLCARTLSLISDLLAGQRQPRSGDSSHPDFVTPIMDLARSKLRSTTRIQALNALADVRDSPYWSDSHEGMLRAARHYDAASQALTARCLFVDDFAFPIAKETVSEGIWIHSTAPARIDLSGGWSDTPPITNESGGAVCNVAVNLKKDVHCLGASARKISSITKRTQFVFRLGHHDETPSSVVVCSEASDFDNCSNPKAPGALAKCVLLAIAPVNDLFSKNVSVELCMWSDLPAGSGMGGSSILAACAVSAVSRVLGFALSKEDLVRVVLKVEQLLSSGGGWQDQIGAIFPMFKIGVSPATLPVTVDVSTIPVPTRFIDEFEARALLIQTGPARLARDLLQNVVRKWHRRDSEFTLAIQNLRENSDRMKEALIKGDIDAVCHELNVFWNLKKFVAGAEQAEPEYVARLFRLTAPYVKARSLCGAGGGGFAVVVLKSPAHEAEFRNTVKDNFPSMQIHNVYLCTTGLRCWKEGESSHDLML